MGRYPLRAAAVVLFAAGCGSSTPTSPSDLSLSERIETAHFVFHYSAGDGVDSAWQEAYHEWAVAELGVTPQVIQYNKYQTRAQMAALTGRGNTNGFADAPASAIHTLFPTDNHEVVHIYAASWGFPVALFEEGLAVAHQTNPSAHDFVPRWGGTALDDLVRRLRALDGVPPIAVIAETAAFRARDGDIMYPVAGSFVRFLIDTQGIGAMRRLYGEMPNDATLSTVRAAFFRTYGFTLDEADARWVASLEFRIPPLVP